MIERAVIPAAGLGSRMLPITKSVPKEILPVGRKPMLQLAIEEIVSCGIKKICIVIRQEKEIIKDYLLLKYPYTHKRDKNIKELEKLIANTDISFVYQEKPLGLGDAILGVRDFVNENPFIMVIPDQFVDSDIPATMQLLSHYKPNVPAIWSSLVKVPQEDLPYFTGSRGFDLERFNGNEFIIRGVRSEKETSVIYKDEPFEIRGIGRTILQPEIFTYLAGQVLVPRSGEIDYVRAFEQCSKKTTHYGLLLQGNPIDLGTFEGYYRYLGKIVEKN